MTFDEVPILDPLIHEFAIVVQEFQLPCANPVRGIRRQAIGCIEKSRLILCNLHFETLAILIESYVNWRLGSVKS